MIDLLRETGVFAEFSDKELEDFSGICERISVNQGDRIFEAESSAEHLYIVSRGAIELRFKVTYYHVSKEVTLERKFKSDAFGWSALTEPYVYTLAAVAMQDSELLKFKASDVKRLSASASHLGHILMRNISEIIAERFVALQRMLIDVIRENLKDKEP
ncbi:MAG: Crp/Fnr family transcriptional regulator [bacterium]